METQIKKCTFFAAIGWGAFISVTLYGVFVYGPAKVKEGALAGAQPASTALPPAPQGDGIDMTMFIQSAIGEIQSVDEDRLVLLSNGQEHIFVITNATEFIRRTLVARPVDPETGLQGGSAQDEPIRASDLQAGQEAEISFVRSDSETQNASRIVIFD